MRYLFPIVLLGMLASGPAGASSLLQRAAEPVSPSIIYYGEPKAGSIETAPDVVTEPPIPLEAPPAGVASADRDPIVVSPSVIALGEPAVESGHVASIGEKRNRRPPPPMVIRGGVSGEPSARPEPAGSPPLQATAPVPAPPVEPRQAAEPSRAPAEPEPIHPSNIRRPE